MKLVPILLFAGVALGAPGLKRPVYDPSKYQRLQVLYPTRSKSPVKAIGIPDERIVGGMEATPHSYPHQVDLLIDSTYQCSGSLIDDQWILTSGYCTDHRRYIVSVLGAHNLLDTTEGHITMETSVSGIFVHEEFGSASAQNDIGMVKLPQPAPNDSDNIKPGIRATKVPDAGTPVTITGWGGISDNGQLTSVLMEVEVDLITNEECRNTFSSITDKQLCTSGEGGKGICDGDVGGPLNYNGEIIGISSFRSAAGCQFGHPSGFTNVPMYKTWIDTVIANNSDKSE